MAINEIGYIRNYDNNTITKKSTCQKAARQDRNGLMEELCKYKEEILEKVNKGDTEPSFSIGASSFTLKQWDKLMNYVDKAIDDMQDKVDAEEEKQEKKKDNMITEQMLEELLGQSTLQG